MFLGRLVIGPVFFFKNQLSASSDSADQAIPESYQDMISPQPHFMASFLAEAHKIIEVVGVDTVDGSEIRRAPSWDV